MDRLKDRLLILLYFIFLIPLLKAQSVEDFGIWTDIEASKELSERIDLSGALSFRTDDNTSHLNQFFYQIGVEAKIVGKLKTGLSYRNRFLFPYTGNEVYHRFIWDTKYTLKTDWVDFQLRNRAQFQLNDPMIDRVRLKADIDIIKKLDGFGYFESFLQPNAPYSYKFYKHRVGIGLEYKLDKSKKISISYMRQTEINQRNPLIFNVIATEFSLKF